MSNEKIMKAIVQVCGSVDPSLGKMVASTEKSLGKINLKAAAVSAAVVAGLGVATKELYDFGKAAVENASTFQSEMQNVATLLDGTEEAVSDRVGEMQKEILSVSNATGVARSELADGMYQVVSAFGDNKEDSIGILETAAKSAAAGNATTTESINLLSAVTKAYGNTSAKAVEKVSDLAFETVKLGQTTYPELAASMGKVTATSSQLGVSQEELFGVFATATGVVGGAAEVSTQLKAIYTKLQKPTKDMAKAIQKMGYKSGKAMIQNLGLQGSLDAISEYSKKAGTNLATLYGSSQAANLATALTGNLSKSLTDKTKAMTEATGATETAFARQEDSLEAIQNRIKNLGENFKTQVGLSILPMVQNLAEKALPQITSLLEKSEPTISSLMTKSTNGLVLVTKMIMDIPEFVSENEGMIKGIAAAVAAVVVAIGLYNTAKAVGTALNAAEVTSLGALLAAKWADVAANTAMAATGMAAIAPILGIAAAIGAVVAIGVALYKNWDTVKLKATELWNKLTEFAYGVRDSFSTAFSSLAGIVKTPINSIIGIVNGAINRINSIGFTVPEWVPSLGGKTFSLNIPKMPLLAAGGFTNGPSIAGEVPGQTEAVISFLPQFRKENIELWQQAGQMLGVTQQQTPLQLAGQLTTLDNFSLADMGATTIIYYDFSNFEYHPEIHNNGGTEKDKTIIQELEENKYEFADWFLNWMSVVTQED